MPSSLGILYRLIIVPAWLLAAAAPLHAQNLLAKEIRLNPARVPLSQALDRMAAKGGFYFSYNSDQVKGDSLVRVPGGSHSVKSLLETLLGQGYQYAESGQYVIIRLPAGDARNLVFRGYVVNKATGERIPEASVYESARFVSTLTDRNGYFQLRIRGPSSAALLHVSKLHFNDTAYLLRADESREVTLGVSPIRTVTLDSVIIKPGPENSWLGRLLISSRQKVTDINLSRFFVRQPFQYSLLPGIGTHGKMSGQVANKFSFNLLGGYSGGVRGVEFAGLFNIDKNDVRDVQVAGLFNTVGGNVRGLQVAGLVNQVMGGVHGVAVGGLVNRSSSSVEGVEIAGLVNQVPAEMRGVQVAGIYNYAAAPAGLQLAGIGNRSDTLVSGAQIGGIFNRAPSLSGLQIGLINLADSSSGYSIGLVNVIRHGRHQLSVGVDETGGITLGFRGGNAKLYSILEAGMSLQGPNYKAYRFGYGLGREIPWSGRLSAALELTEQSVYLGSWRNLPLLTRFSPILQWQLRPGITIAAGPAFSVYFQNPIQTAHGYRDLLPAHHLHLASRVNAWPGFQASLHFF